MLPSTCKLPSPGSVEVVPTLNASILAKSFTNKSFPTVKLPSNVDPPSPSVSSATPNEYN